MSAEREARRVCLDDHPDAAALLGLLGDELVGVASYELASEGASAEVVVAVDARIRVTSHRLADPFLRQLPVNPGRLVKVMRPSPATTSYVRTVASCTAWVLGTRA